MQITFFRLSETILVSKNSWSLLDGHINRDLPLCHLLVGVIQQLMIQRKEPHAQAVKVARGGVVKLQSGLLLHLSLAAAVPAPTEGLAAGGGKVGSFVAEAGRLFALSVRLNVVLDCLRVSGQLLRMRALGLAVDSACQSIKAGLLAEDALRAGSTQVVAQVDDCAKPLLTTHWGVVPNCVRVDGMIEK